MKTLILTLILPLIALFSFTDTPKRLKCEQTKTNYYLRGQQDIELIEFDSCQYIIINDAFGNIKAFTHKGNCTRCEAKKK